MLDRSRRRCQSRSLCKWCMLNLKLAKLLYELLHQLLLKLLVLLLHLLYRLEQLLCSCCAVAMSF